MSTQDEIMKSFDDWYESITAEGVICNRWDAWQAWQYCDKQATERQITKDAEICETCGHQLPAGGYYARQIRNQQRGEG